jgi:hypothetical protein
MGADLNMSEWIIDIGRPTINPETSMNPEFIIDEGRLIISYSNKIFIGTPFCNENHSIDKYMESLKNIDYPKSMIDVLWIENNSSDDTWERLTKCLEEFKTYGYNSIRLIRKRGNYKNLLKCEANEVGCGKISNNNSYPVRQIRAKHLAGLFNFIMEESIRLKCDYCLTIVADVIVPLNTITKFLDDFKILPDCGWIGVALHKRFPNHKRLPEENPHIKGLGCPVMKILDKEPAPLGYKEEWMSRRKRYKVAYYEKKYPDIYPYPFGFYTMIDEDLMNRYKFSDGLFECCLVGHIWMIPDYVINRGLRLKVALVESGVDATLQLNNMGYKMYCDSHVYAKHISVNGKVWVDMIDGKIIFLNESVEKLKREGEEFKKRNLIPIKEPIKEPIKPSIKEPLPIIKEKSKEKTKKDDDDYGEYEKYLACKKRYNNNNYTIPDRPPSNGTIRDPLLKKDLNQEVWDKIYGKWLKYMGRSYK